MLFLFFSNPFLLFSLSLKFNSEAVIVNFYHLDSMLCGHFDDAEQTTTSFPLVSISLGCSAVFLIAPSKDVDPVPLLLRSGDVVIMSGPSRNYYHGFLLCCFRDFCCGCGLFFCFVLFKCTHIQLKGSHELSKIPFCQNFKLK